MSKVSKKIYSQLEKNKLFSKKVVFGLKRIKLALNKLGHPEKKLKNVCQFIASDGKFSLLTFLKYFLEADGKTASAHISPSLVTIRERFWLGKRYASYKEIRKSIQIIKKLKIPLTIYEVLTLVFFLNAYKKNNQFCLQEAGALWAKDSNNVIENPRLVCIGNINNQHFNFVRKKTLGEIVRQKVDFLSKNTRIYIGQQKPGTLKIIKEYLKKNPSKKIYSNNWRLIKKKNTYFYKDARNKIIIKRKYMDQAFMDNLSMVIKIALDLGIRKKIIELTIPKIEIIGRVQHVKKGKLKNMLNKQEELILDGCHSEVSSKNLAKYLRQLRVSNKIGIFGILKSRKKEASKILKNFKGIFKTLLVLKIPETNSVSSYDLKKIATKHNFNVLESENLRDALKKISTNKKKIITIFGSLYLIANALSLN